MVEVIALTRSELRSSRTSLQTQLADGLPLVLGDRIQLQQVMLNLILNAAEAMSGSNETPRDLLIRTEQDGPGGVLVAVQDSGPGLEPDSLIGSSMPSTRPNRAAWAWDCRFAGRSSRRMASACGPRKTYPRAPPFSSLCRRRPGYGHFNSQP
jgi:hypothetical protein